MGHALTMLAEQLRIPPMSDRALPPVLVLISDGQPTDDFNQGLHTLMNEASRLGSGDDVSLGLIWQDATPPR